MGLTPGRSWQNVLPFCFSLFLTIPLAVLASKSPKAQEKSPPAPLGADSPFFLIDLSRHVNLSLDDSQMNDPGNNLSDLLAGMPTDAIPVKFLKKIPFRQDGIVLVGPLRTGTAEHGMVSLPAKVEGIPIGRRAQRLHFLHSMHYGSNAHVRRVGTYVVHFADGSRKEIPIRFGEDVLDWWGRTSDMFPPAGSPDVFDGGGRSAQGSSRDVETSSPALINVVWRGYNSAAKTHGFDHIRLFLKTWKNPDPEKEIVEVNMLAGEQGPGIMSPAPFLVALTGELDVEFHLPAEKAPPSLKRRPSQ